MPPSTPRLCHVAPAITPKVEETIGLQEIENGNWKFHGTTTIECSFEDSSVLITVADCLTLLSSSSVGTIVKRDRSIIVCAFEFLSRAAWDVEATGDVSR